MNEVVSREQQEAQGLLRSVPARFVAPELRPKLDIMPAHTTSVLVDHPATQEVIVHTSAVDRAAGYQIMITPIALVLAVLAVLVSFVFDNEFFTFASLLIFWITFALIYGGGWIMTWFATPEMVSWYGAKRQWDVIEREQVERWNHYRWQSGRSEPPQRGAVRSVTSFELPTWALLLAGLVGVFTGLAYLLGGI